MNKINDHSRKRLLAIDDNADSAALIARIAEKCGFETKFVSDIGSLREILQHWKPEVITLDLCMPDVDGFAVITLLKEIGFGGKLIIASGQNAWLRQGAWYFARSSGIDVTPHLQKPINIQTLRDVLNSLQVAV